MPKRSQYKFARLWFQKQFNSKLADWMALVKVIEYSSTEQGYNDFIMCKIANIFIRIVGLYFRVVKVYS